MLKLLSEKNFIRNALITIYILIVLGISATARAEMTINPIFTDHESIQTETFVGEVAMTVNQEFYLIVSEQEYYQLESNIDLFDFNGQKVAVEAVKMKHLNGPVSGVFSLDPLPGKDAQAEAAPVLIVLGISGAAN